MEKNFSTFVKQRYETKRVNKYIFPILKDLIIYNFLIIFLKI